MMAFPQNESACVFGQRRFFRLSRLVIFVMAIFLASACVSMAASPTHAKGHPLKKVAKVSATCKKNGVKAHYECTKCHKKYLTLKDAKKGKKASSKKLKIKKLSHSYKKIKSKKALKKAATCTSKPVYYYSCKRCGAKNKKKTFKGDAALGHTYVLTSATNTKETRQCLRCKKKITKDTGIATPAWAKHSMVAHAGGGIDTVTYSNSLQALRKTLKSNVSCVEIDFAWTSDHKLVCAHDFLDFDTGIPLLDKFLTTLYSQKYTRMSAETALKMLSDNGKIHLLVDTKEKNAVAVYSEIKRLLTAMGRQSYMDMVVPQIYSKENYDQFRAVYPFKEGIFAVYKIKDKEFTAALAADLADFCSQKHLAVSISKKRATDKMIRIFNKEKVYLIVHTVNNGSTWNTLFSKGIKAIFTDNLY